MAAASVRKIREKIEWKVPIHKYRARSAPTRRAIRSFISRAALLVKVRARIDHGS